MGKKSKEKSETNSNDTFFDDSKPEIFAHKERKCLCRGCYMTLKGAHERLFGKKLGYTAEDKLSVYQSIDDFLHYTQFFDLAHFTEENQADVPIILHLIYSNREKEEQSLCDSSMNDVTDLIFERIILPSMTPEERMRHFGYKESHNLPNSSLYGPKDGLPSSSFYI
ncbi:hypothetical protein NEF87_003245 [Candidatus Lokiarchaeum ossiferum]|uniref:Uncharacterized protein n=1 Tax=Candidatus Lokiarchaeum ossiferum TaxID=2951803 RepID=A0ABY6HTW3_9ARCH|nr:hypothetical protein NEF87_003245 [Candidatus Lokiarchaeum sp. B-35]